VTVLFVWFAERRNEGGTKRGEKKEENCCNNTKWKMGRTLSVGSDILYDSIIEMNICFTSE